MKGREERREGWGWCTSYDDEYADSDNLADLYSLGVLRPWGAESDEYDCFGEGEDDRDHVEPERHASAWEEGVGEIWACDVM